MDLDRYCRDIETYLCRKNDGHLIRVVGPSFDRVSGWAARGVPIKVVYRGIDRYVDRYYAKGPRRRPVRIDFCEADVLDVFDEWRRAVGVRGGPDVLAAAGADEEASERAEEEGRPRRSLAAHLERLTLKLTALRGGANVSPALDAALDRAVREVDAARAEAKRCRGAARAALVDRIAALDRDVLAAAREDCPPSLLEALAQDADEELSPFRARMADEAFRRARDRSVDRLLRERAGLPQIAFE